MARRSEPRTLSERAAGLPRSAIREVMALAAGRPNVIHLEVGEPDFGTPPEIVADACAAIRAGATRYTANAGTSELRKAIAKRVAQRTETQVSPERVVVTVGAVGALYGALMSVLDTGDEVLIPDPGWSNYESIVLMAGARPVRYRLDPTLGFLPDTNDFRKLIGPRTKAIVVNSPGNPTGAVFPMEFVRSIAAAAQRTGIYVISDEVYEDIVFDGLAHISLLGHCLPDRTFIVSGVSKTFAMTGWRLGWCVCPPAAVPLVEKLQEPVVSCAPSPSQAAALAALKREAASPSIARGVFQRRRDIFLEEIASIGLAAHKPEGAFYGLIDVSSRAPTALEFARALLTEADVAVVPGETFGSVSQRMVRIAFTIEDERLREGLRRIREFLTR